MLASRECIWAFTAPNSLDCSKCQETTAAFQCLGCGDLFCVRDANTHRNDLNHQLRALQNQYDEFDRNSRTSSDDYLARLELENDRYRREIERWQIDSTKMIEDWANEAKDRLQDRYGRYSRIPTIFFEKSADLGRQLDHARVTEDFHDEHLKRWRKALHCLSQDMAEVRTSFARIDLEDVSIKKIVVHEEESMIKSDENIGDKFTPHIQLVIPTDYNSSMNNRYELRSGTHRFQFKSKKAFFGISIETINQRGPL